jgi:hypothetical protein
VVVPINVDLSIAYLLLSIVAIDRRIEYPGQWAELCEEFQDKGSKLTHDHVLNGCSEEFSSIKRGISGNI